MKVKELIVTNDKVVANYEIYYSPFGKESFHTDNIRRYDEQDAMEKQVIKYAVMDESEYDSTICANTDPADFSEWYDNKDAKVLVILVNKTESAWVFNEYRDKAGTGEYKTFETKEEAIAYAKDEWNHLNESDQDSYIYDKCGEFWVAQLDMVYDDVAEEYEPDFSSYSPVWSAF